MHTRLQRAVYYLLMGLAAGVWHRRLAIQVDAESDIEAVGGESPYDHVLGGHAVVELFTLGAGPYGTGGYGRVQQQYVVCVEGLLLYLGTYHIGNLDNNIFKAKKYNNYWRK